MAETPAPNFGEYRIIREIGKGGFGAVYLAENTLFPGHRFAIKIFRHREDGADLADPLRDELNNIVGLVHPNIVQVRGFGVETSGKSPEPYIVMDFIEGPNGTSYNLKQHLQSSGGKLAPEEVHRIFLQILKALSVVHEKRIAHLDLKPQNILLDKKLNAYISDFGISQAVSSMSAEQETRVVIHGLTPTYASPEQIQHGTGSRHSDMFSLGVMLLECLTGTRPEVIHSRSNPIIDYGAPSSFGLDAHWDELVANCLAIDAADRYANASSLLHAFEGESPGTGYEATVLMGSRKDGITTQPMGGSGYTSTVVKRKTSGRRSKAVLVGGFCVVLAAAVAGGVYVGISSSKNGGGPDPSGSASSGEKPPEKTAVVKVDPPVAEPVSVGQVDPQDPRGPSPNEEERAAEKAAQLLEEMKASPEGGDEKSAEGSAVMAAGGSDGTEGTIPPPNEPAEIQAGPPASVVTDTPIEVPPPPDIPTATPTEEEIPTHTPTSPPPSPTGTNTPMPTSTSTPTPTATPTCTSTATPTPTSQYVAIAADARKKAEAAQAEADSAAADRIVPELYLQAQQSYGIALESLKIEQYQRAAEKFGEAANTFVRAASTAEPIRKQEEAQAARVAELQVARDFSAQTKWVEAEKAYQAYLGKYPSDGPAALEYAFMVFQNVSYARGSAEMRKCLKMPGITASQRGQIYAAIAQWYHSSGHLSKAIPEMRNAVMADPSNASLRSILMQYEAEQAEIERRKAEQQRAIGSIGGALLREALK